MFLKLEKSVLTSDLDTRTQKLLLMKKATLMESMAHGTSSTARWLHKLWRRMKKTWKLFMKFWRSKNQTRFLDLSLLRHLAPRKMRWIPSTRSLMTNTITVAEESVIGSLKRRQVIKEERRRQVIKEERDASRTVPKDASSLVPSRSHLWSLLSCVSTRKAWGTARCTRDSARLTTAPLKGTWVESSEIRCTGRLPNLAADSGQHSGDKCLHSRLRLQSPATDRDTLTSHQLMLLFLTSIQYQPQLPRCLLPNPLPSRNRRRCTLLTRSGNCWPWSAPNMFESDHKRESCWLTFSPDSKKKLD